MNNESQEFDAIVIGSGIGGLTTAAILAKFQNKKVLVLEQHFTPGGFTHAFERKGKFHWDVGLHYVGEMNEGSLFRKIFDYLSNNKLQWQKMPNHFDKFVYPDFTFAVDSDPDRFQADLIQQFPKEESGIRRYFQDVQKAATWMIMHHLIEIFPRFLQPIIKPIFHYFGAISRQTTQQYLDHNFTDTQLKALLTSQWGDYGLTPAQSCFGIHSIIVTHYFQGGWYPVGGAASIAQTIIPVIEQSGGKVLTQRRVTEILLNAGRATGVKVQNMANAQAAAETYNAPVVISDAGAFNTYLKLIPPSFPLVDREAIQAFPKGSNVFTLYLGLKDSPKQLGFQGENHWISDTYDHEESGHAPPISAENLPLSCYLSFPSLKDACGQGHTAEIIASADYHILSQWRKQLWKRRDQDYQELKSHITELLIQFVEDHYPGFKDLIEYTELATPLTFEHFNDSDCGTIYGIPCIPARMEQSWVGSKTPIQNLYLTGADAFTPGVTGAMMGGVKTAGLVKGALGFLQIMLAINKK